MKTKLSTKKPQEQSKICLVIGIYEDGILTPTAEIINQATQGYIKKLIDLGAFQGKLGQVLPIFHIAEFSHILLIGCGKPSSIMPSFYRRIIMSAVQALITTKTKEAISYLTELDVKDQSLAWKVKQTVETAYEGIYQFNIFKSEKETVLLNELSVSVPDAQQLPACEQALAQGEAIASGVWLTKNLANTPSNICTPSFLAEQALELSKDFPSITINILEEKDMQKLGMGALLAVSQGSAQDSKLICLEYKNKEAKNQAPIALVGKGITFDTGGNSLKTPENMVGMKYDMCGAATVLGTIKAAAELKLPLHVVGIIPAVENMPGGTAYKPEDILTSLSGQTIEVISTDAEGRLILGDALTYCERYKPEVVIDIATLTGACVIALGHHASGLLSNHDPLAMDLLKAGEESTDRAWQLPLWEEYQEQIKSPFADISNTGGRAAGTITAGCFLSRFAKNFHWAHLDVAGTAAMMFGTNERMATGRPVPLLMQYLITRAQAK